MSSVKEAAYIHCGVKIGIFKPEEITEFSYMLNSPLSSRQWK
jgi:hypothetical protein